MSIKDKVKEALDRAVDKYDDDAYEARDKVVAIARDDLKALWAENGVFRAAVIAAGTLAVLVVLVIL